MRIPPYPLQLVYTILRPRVILTLHIQEFYMGGVGGRRNGEEMLKKIIVAASHGLPDDKDIIGEYKRLYKLFGDAPEKHLEVIRKLINRAAFLSITIDRLEADILQNGYEEEYQNGANQTGKKKTAAAELHISYSKNLFSVMKQLTDFLQKENQGDEDDEFDRFIR